VLHGLANWWDGVELWVLGLPFGFQFALVMAVLLPLCVIVPLAYRPVSSTMPRPGSVRPRGRTAARRQVSG